MAQDGKLVVTGDYLTTRMSIHQAVGRAAEAEYLAELYRKRSGERFAAGKDEEAKLFRGLAKEMEERSRQARNSQRVLQEEVDQDEPVRLEDTNLGTVTTQLRGVRQSLVNASSYLAQFLNDRGGRAIIENAQVIVQGMIAELHKLETSTDPEDPDEG